MYGNDDLLSDLFLNWLLCLKMPSIRFGRWRDRSFEYHSDQVLRLERFGTISKSKTGLDPFVYV